MSLVAHLVTVTSNARSATLAAAGRFSGAINHKVN